MPAPTMPLPTRTVSTILGLMRVEALRTGMSCTSFGVKLNFQSMIITSSSVSTRVRTESIKGALVPSVKVVRLSESRKGGQLSRSIVSTC